MKHIAYVTDIHLDEAFPIENGVAARKNWLRILEDISYRGIVEVIFGGDIGEAKANSWFFESLKPFDLKITLGNHDTFSEAIKHYDNEYLDGKKELYYSCEHEFLKCIYLDSSSGEISPKQLTWLKDELITTKKILIFIHHPVLEVNIVVDKKYPLKNREEVKSLLKNVKNDIMIFCGHYHTTDDKTEGNIRQLVTLAASYQITKGTDTVNVENNSFGYRILSIEEDLVETELVVISS